MSLKIGTNENLQNVKCNNNGRSMITFMADSVLKIKKWKVNMKTKSYLTMLYVLYENFAGNYIITPQCHIDIVSSLEQFSCLICMIIIDLIEKVGHNNNIIKYPINICTYFTFYVLKNKESQINS